MKNFKDMTAEEIFKVARKFQPMGKHFTDTIQMPQQAINTGIIPLDEALQGVMPNDFIVIGASTGAGKTALATKIARTAALEGKKVALFALEAYEGEISDRMKFPQIAGKWFKAKGYPLNYKMWKRGEYNSLGLPEMEKVIIDSTPKCVQDNLLVRYRTTSEYSVDDFLHEIECLTYRDKIDLIVVDHLHYFSLPDDQSENRALKRIVNTLRDYGLLQEIPIVLFAHMRKKPYGSKSPVPSLDEFHGSSEITKNATAVITFAPAFDIKMPTTYQFPTYIQVGKDRFNGAIKRYTMAASFDIRSGEYEKDYQLYSVKASDELELVEDKRIPEWAVHAKREGSTYKTRMGSV